jgi:two-component system sensor histidine kinase KdpD
MTNFKNKEYLSLLKYALITTSILTIATGISWAFRYIGFPETNIVIVYLLSILITARFTHGYIYGMVASIIATCAFNYFFTKPYFTLSVNDPTYFITFAIMTITAFITSALTSKVKKNALEAQEKEAEASALFQLTNQLTDAGDIAHIASITTATISSIMDCLAACLCFDENGHPEQSFIQQKSTEDQTRRKVADTKEIKYRMEALRTAFDKGDEFWDWPIYGRETILGVLRIPSETAAAMVDPQMRLLRSMIESTALAMDRFRSAEDRQKSREETIQERYRSNLLRAISHDLRTPLSGIMGTAEMLMDMTDSNDPRHALANEINKDADWLHSLVQNILSLTRLQEGRLTITKQFEAVEEVIGGAVTHMMKRSPEYDIKVSIPEEVLLVPMDAKLIEQVLINLLDNAVKHTLSDHEISISVIEDNIKNTAIFSVTDEGCGISASDLPHIFQMFYTTHARHADSQRGVGLGLSICEAIIKAHGGSIECHNRADKQGTEFLFTLPMEVQNNAN